MLSLFSSNKSSDRAPKQKQKSESFDLDSFLTTVAPTTKDFTVHEPNPKPIQNVEEDRIIHVPSKSALKVLDEVHRRPEHIPKEIDRVSKKLSKSIKQLEEEHHRAQNLHKAAQNKIKKHPEDVQRATLKHRPDPQYHKKSDFNSHDRYGNNSYEDSSTSFSRMSAPHRKESSPPTSKNLTKKPHSKPRDNDNERLELPEDFDLLHLQKNESYDPLDFVFAPPTMKHESSELYDPLNVSIRKNSEEQPSRPSKLENSGLLAKRPGVGGSDRSGYEPDISKKIKTDEQRKRLDAIFKGSKNPPPKPQAEYNPHRPRKNTHSSEEDRYIDDQGDYDDDARKEMEKMFGNYRKKANMRRHLEDDSDDMEAGFDDLEREERISRHIGHKEDQEQLRYIQMEEMNEKRGKVQ